MLYTSYLYPLRFIASILVVLFHYSPVRNFVINNGGEAVNFFYLISGYVMIIAYTDKIKNNKFSIRNFLINRILRIYPAYFLALVLTLGAHYLTKPFLSSIWSRFSFEVLMIQSWFYPGSMNYPGWSVSNEFFFYITFAFLILPFALLRRNKKLILIVSFLILSLIVSLVFSAIANDQNNMLLKGYMTQSPLIRVIIFWTGVYIGYLHTQLIAFKVWETLTLIGLSVALFYLNTYLQNGFGILPKDLALILLYFVSMNVLAKSVLIESIMKINFMKVLGDISYGIYIFQCPIAVIYFYLTNENKTTYNFIGYITVLLLFSFLIDKLLENPIKQIKNKVS